VIETISESRKRMYALIKALVLPPASLVLLLALGLLLQTIGWRRLGLGLSAFVLLSLYLLSTPYIAGRLGAAVQSIEPLAQDVAADEIPQAIVVLSAGLLPYAPEYKGSAVDELTLQRLAYAAYLWRQYQVPILVSGGNTPDADKPLARLMQESLERVFGVPVEWVEDKSINTYENAQFSAALLREAHVDKIFLVTHAAHMPRATGLFRMTGLTVSSAPTAFTAAARTFPDSFVPRQSSFQSSYYAVYELLGGLWYAVLRKTSP